MRVLSAQEKRQHGCCCCADVAKAGVNGQVRTACPFDECPYKVLDKYESYEKYMESEDCRILVGEFFQTVAGCYTLSWPGREATKSGLRGDSRVIL